nr:retrovirus-related Pol polyprotein from transposon TNT 1-94 [Tanacetum cinerariifolium]
MDKKNKHGIVTKNKARLVAQGYSQEERIDYDETFAPVARMEAIRIFLAFATYMNFILFPMDVKSAILNGKLKKEVYVKQPSDFESSKFPNYICKLDKALYGLKQAPKAWYETLSTFLIQNKFVRGRIDNTLFIYKSKGDVLLVQVVPGKMEFRINDVPQLVDKKEGSYATIAPKLELIKFNKWKKRMLCYLARMEPYYLKCIKDGLFQPKTAKGDTKPESQLTPDKKRVVVQDQQLKIIIMSCLLDDVMESVIICVSAKETWTDLVHSFEGPSDTKENRIMDLKLEYQTFRAKSTESLSQTYTRYKTLLNELANDCVNLSKHEINVGFINSLPEKWLTFSQGLRNANHTQTLDLADIYGRFVYEDNLIQIRYSDTKKTEYKKMEAKLAFFDASSSSPHNPKTFQLKNKGLVVEIFDLDEEEVFEDEEITQVKVSMALADDELTVRKSHAQNGKWVDITIRQENYILVIVDEYSRYTWVYFLRKKCQAPKIIMSFVRMVENQNDVKVKQIRTDNKIEFRNNKLESFCDEKGISQIFYFPYTPEQNGIAERKDKTLIEAARTMLNGSVLSKHFWTEAVKIACYTQNKSIIVKRHDKTPYEIFRERIPDVSYFYVFGCLVFIHNHKDHLGKFDAKADDGYFLGYSSVSKAIRVYNIRR